ncbi:hypothetical protein D3C78_1754410 [compost metagenome]
MGIGQFEAHHAIALLRQTDDAPLDPAGFAVERGGQPIVQRTLRRQAGPGQPEQEKTQRVASKRQRHQRQHRHDCNQPQRRQCR